MKIKNMKFETIRFVGLGLLAISLRDLKEDLLNNYFVHFSFKEPWWKPHKEFKFGNGSYMYGWLFFYFGNVISKKEGEVNA